MNKWIFTYLVLSVFCLSEEVLAQERLKTSARAQVNSWGTINFNDPIKYQLAARFIPEIHFEKSLGSIQLDTEFSFNTVGSLDYQEWDNTGDYEKFSPYRIWARLSGPQFEVRLGLQKINFGSANMLRPLMWFDRIDPRDPLQITEGVYGLLGRYYFKNNANIWLWGLVGNNETKGWEVIPSTRKDPEVGGRFQFPIATGEAAISFHHRKADLNEFYKQMSDLSAESFSQNRYAVDGKWDIGPGVWFEYVLEQNNAKNVIYPLKYQHTVNVGLDYTFAWGNGLNASTEFFYITQSDDLLGSEANAELSALSLNYPIGLIDQVSAIIYYSWNSESWYRFVSLQRTYDFWSFYLMGFWNPESFELYNVEEKKNLFTGKGMQVMAVYNF